MLAPYKLPNYLAILGACSPGLNRFAGLLPDPPKGNAEIRTATKNMILRLLPYAYKDGSSLFLFFFELSTIPVALTAFRTRQKFR
jgi:hypothetical protein